MNTDKHLDLSAENAELRARLAEAEETLEAIRSGAVDALLVTGQEGEQVFTLEGAEKPYRLLMESMNEGAATISRDGTILYCNRRFAELTGLPAEQVVGSGLGRCVVPEQQAAVRELLAKASPGGLKAEFTFAAAAGPGLPVQLSVRPTPMGSEVIALVATDLSERKAHERMLRQLNQELEVHARRRTAELQAIFDTAPIGLAIAHDPEGRRIQGNPAIEQALGLGRGDELSRGAPQSPPYRCLEDGRELPTEQLPMQRAARGETITGHVLDVLRADGRTITLYGNAAPLLDEQGRPRGSVGAFLDITELKRAEAALRESESRYRAIGESIDYGVWICAPDGRNLYASPSFLKLVGMTQEQCSNFGWGDALHPDDAARTLAAWKECVRTGGRWDIEHRFRGVDGKYHPVLARGVPVRNDQGEIVSWVGINLDISRVKEAEESLRRHAEELRASNSELARFNQAMVGRELRMIELKREINELCLKLSQPTRYPLQVQEQPPEPTLTA